jgi:hypothetical protein
VQSGSGQSARSGRNLGYRSTRSGQDWSWGLGVGEIRQVASIGKYVFVDWRIAMLRIHVILFMRHIDVFVILKNKPRGPDAQPHRKQSQRLRVIQGRGRRKKRMQMTKKRLRPRPRSSISQPTSFTHWGTTSR